MGAIVIHTIEGYKCSRRQICTFRGAHVNPPTKIVLAKWGSPDIRFDSEHNRLSHGVFTAVNTHRHLHWCVLIPQLAAATATS